ncbi:MAG: hypothetical protein ABI420_01720 [Opitutaceae bacterium]
MQIVFMLVGAGLGFAIYSPITAEHPVADLSTGAVVVEGISAVFSLWFGGWVAGRFSRRNTRHAGWLHGLLVWGSMMIAGVALVGAGAGWALGDLSQLVGGGLSLAAKPAAAAVSGGADLAKSALKKSGDSISSYVQEATESLPADASKSTTTRAKREVGLAATRFFTASDDSSRSTNRADLITALTNSGMSQPAADKLVNEWTASYDHLKKDLQTAKDEAAAKARVAADEAAHTLMIFCLVSAIAFLLGAAAAAAGGCQGTKFAVEHDLDREVVL